MALLDGDWKGRRLEGTLDPDVVATRGLEGTLDPDVVATRGLEGTLDPDVVDGKVGSRRS